MRLACAALVLLVCLVLFSKSVLAEVFTATSGFKQLLDYEILLSRTLGKYITYTENRLEQLKKQAERYNKEVFIAERNVEQYLSNPMNDFLLVKRLRIDWFLTDLEMQDQYYEFLKTMKEYINFPGNDDLFGTAMAIIRLQNTYKLDTKSVARGERRELAINQELSASDCFELGKQSYTGGFNQHAEAWLDEALARNDPNIRWMILEYLMRAAFMNGKVQKAKNIASELLSIHPMPDLALNTKKRLEAAVKYGSKKAEWPEKEQSPPITSMNPAIRERYYEACRNDGPPPVEIVSQLRCRYTNVGGNPFLLIGPLREEEASLDPRIVLYRNILSDREMDKLMIKTFPKLKRGAVQNGETGECKYVDFRVSKSALFVNEDDAELVARLTKRIEAMTGLSAGSAEPFEIINYGLGGHYEPHYDYFNSLNFVESFGIKNKGNRIATVLIYITDVEQGGSTVFLDLGLAVRPVRGTALVWYNLLPDGTGDPRTFHAACPVLRGSKWICNKWLHEAGQEFRRPCDLKQNNIQGTSGTQRNGN